MFHRSAQQEKRIAMGHKEDDHEEPTQTWGGMTMGMFTGCPLHNLVPEWNDLIYTGSPGHALSRLCKTNSFPEFTGRVCPALCEAACTCGLNGEPVTIRENELAIIEEGFAAGWSAGIWWTLLRQRRNANGWKPEIRRLMGCS